MVAWMCPAGSPIGITPTTHLSHTSQPAGERPARPAAPVCACPPRRARGAVALPLLLRPPAAGGLGHGVHGPRPAARVDAEGVAGTGLEAEQPPAGGIPDAPQDPPPQRTGAVD